MGFIKAFTGAISGTFADQWLEYMKPDFESMKDTSTVAIYPAIKVSGGQNVKGNDNIISNGSKIIVPKDTALITMLDGAVTGCICEPGGYIYSSTDPNAKSFFGDGLWEGIKGVVQSSWERTKHGNLAAAQHNAFYVNMKPIANNKFGTPGPIYWDDAFLQTQVAASMRGTYTLQIVDPITFLTFVPTEYQMAGKVYDFADPENRNAEELFNNVVDSLTTALSIYSNDPTRGNRISKLQSDKKGLADALTQAVEQEHNWRSTKGIIIVDTSIISLDYDEETKKILAQAKQDDVNLRNEMRRGQAFSNNMPGMMAASTASAMNAAAGNENGAMMGFMGMGFAQNQGANVLNTVNTMPQQPVQPITPTSGGMMPQQPVQQQPVQEVAPVAPVTPEVAPAPEVQQPTPEVAQPTAAPAQAEDPYQKLTKMKELLDAGVISQEDFDAAKKNLLGI